MPTHGPHRSGTEYRFEPPIAGSRGGCYYGAQCMDDDSDGVPSLEDRGAAKPSVFRNRCSQVLANFSCQLLVLDLCMAFSFTTIVIAALLDAKEGLSINKTEASWLGSIAYICQPVGSVMSGMIVEFFGRKWSMIIVNAPFLLGWILYSVSNSVVMLYVTNVIIGVGIGFMEAPIMTYIAETSQPELRGILTSLPGIMVQISFFIVYLMGTVMDWRTAAGISASLPIFTALYVTQVPETPIWLLSRGRRKDAERALCWLRGWTTPDVVREEFNQLVTYSDGITNRSATPMIQMTTVSKNEDDHNTIGSCDSKDPTNQQARADGSDQGEDNESSHCSFDRWKEMVQPSTLRPLMLVIPYFLMQQLAGMASIRPYMVHVFRQFGLDDVAEWTTVGSAVIGIIGATCLVCTVQWLGKRFLSLASLAGNAVACLLLAIYNYVVLRPGGAAEYAVTWLPLALIILFSFFSSVMFEVPWMMLSEIFPFRTRGIASGFSAAMCYIFLFIVSKTYLDMEDGMRLYGAFLFFAAVNVVGLIFVYCRMPRMEGKTLAEIEEYFSGQNQKGFSKR